jgi:hypothetical protein
LHAPVGQQIETDREFTNVFFNDPTDARTNTSANPDAQYQVFSTLAEFDVR